MTKLEKRIGEFNSELSSYSAWDSEFRANPYNPWGAIRNLAELGAEALPFFCELCGRKRDSFGGDDRLYGIYGLELLGARAGTRGLAVLEPLSGLEHTAREAAVAIGRVSPERFFELKLFTNTNAVGDLTQKHREEGTAATWLARVLALGEEKSSAAAVRAISDLKLEERELVLQLRRALMSELTQVRAAASWVLAKVPNATPVEALIESMVTSGRAEPIEAVAWHPDSIVLAELAARKRHIGTLASLLMRRRCAGLHTPSEPLRGFVEEWLRKPNWEHPGEQHEVHEAAKCALELGDDALVPALVEAVKPSNSGYAWQPLVSALLWFGPKARAALEVRAKTADAQRGETISWMLQRLDGKSLGLDWADEEFVRGSIDHTTGGAFARYADVLREKPSAHAAFQLAWIDRAFGATILPARLDWIRSLGCRDEALLKELATPVTPLEGLRLSWRSCEAKDADRIAAAGLPGIAFTGSRNVAHQEAAKAHVARVKAACR